MFRFITLLAVAALTTSVVACGGSSTARSVFDGVDDEDLAHADVVVLDRSPTATPRFSDEGLRRTLSQSIGMTIDASQLVLVRPKGTAGSESRGHLAWAIRVNTSQVPDSIDSCYAGPPECRFGPGDFVIMFYDAESGRTLGSYSPVRPEEAQLIGTPVP